MDNETLIPHLFRTEYRKIIAVLYTYFGFEQSGIAEDIAGETFLTAMQSWGINGAPQNPAAWLYHVAKNKAKNYVQRQSVFEKKIIPGIKASQEIFEESEIDLSPENINDSQLQMMFAICHPSISAEAQIGLSLRILCGFGIEEIADAFLSNKETINKRLFRAKEKLREEKINIALPAPAEIDERLSSVLRTIYLLFNEGYFSQSQDKIFRKELCMEAMRLCAMLVENTYTNKPAVNALLSLMCFHASRFDARMNKEGEHVLYAEQDASLWNSDLVSKGVYFLHCASSGNSISKYHLEAGIAYWNTQKDDTKEKWEHILQLYNHLLQIEYSQAAALNRNYAFSKVYGNAAAIVETEKMEMPDNHFYFMLLGELYTEKDKTKATAYFINAAALAKTQTEKQTIQKKIDKLTA